MKKVAEYKDLKFKTIEEFEGWLAEKTKYIVTFENGGQDFSKWWIDGGGEILHSDLQGRVWDSCIVDTTTIKKGGHLLFDTEFDKGRVLDYKIVDVERVE